MKRSDLHFRKIIPKDIYKGGVGHQDWFKSSATVQMRRTWSQGMVRENMEQGTDMRYLRKITDKTQ